MADIKHKAPAEDAAPMAEDLKTAAVERVREYQHELQRIDEQPGKRTAKEKDKDEEKKERLKPSADELRAALEARGEQISRRVEAIQEEVARVPGEVGEAIVRNPLVSVAVSLGAGLAVGLLIGGIGRRKAKLPAAHQALVHDYLDALADEARTLIRRGEDAGSAIRRALGKHTPIVVTMGQPDLQTPSGFMRTAFDMAVKTALGFGVKVALDKLMVTSGLAEEDPGVEHAVESGGGPEVIAAATEPS